MREIAFVDIIDEIRKVLIFESGEGVYLFGYDCLQDTSSKWDNWYTTVEEAKEYCKDIYHIDNDKWIAIAEPLEFCQHDFILPTKIKGRETSKLQYGKFQTLVNGKWVDIENVEKCLSFDGLTGNERLFLTGLNNEYDLAKKKDKIKARKILKALEFDEESIDRLL